MMMRIIIIIKILVREALREPAQAVRVAAEEVEG
jgi:hypothetical protein